MLNRGEVNDNGGVRYRKLPTGEVRPDLLSAAEFAGTIYYDVPADRPRERRCPEGESRRGRSGSVAGAGHRNGLAAQRRGEGRR
jgi:hypothetical protein